MKNHPLRGCVVVALALAGCAQASYYTLAPDTKEPKECVTFDVRFPAWTHGTYIATYPHHSLSKEGWGAPYYGGVVSSDRADGRGQLIQFASWQMFGKDAPPSGIDFVHAGPHMSWQRSTWEGSSGGIKGLWPDSQFKPGQWYRFYHRVWTPATPAPHLGYAGVWMKSLETGEWFHLATFKFPAELTGFNDMNGFVERFTGNASPDASVEFRNCYSLCGGHWKSEALFSARNGGGNTIRLLPGAGDRSVTLETKSNPLDPATKKPKKGEVIRQKFTLKQPAAPDFLDATRITAPSAEGSGRQLVVRWGVDAKAAPQLGYEVAVFEGSARLAAAAANEPEARQCLLTLPAAPTHPLTVQLRLRDIFNTFSPTASLAVGGAALLPAVRETGLVPGLDYRYFESPKPETWSALPEVSKLAPARSGTVALPDITPRLRRTGYAFTFNGWLNAPETGLYVFHCINACGARLLLDGRPVIVADGYHSIAGFPGTVALAAGLHTVSLAYYQGKAQQLQADDFLQLAWTGPSFARTTVPATAFLHKAAAKNSEVAPVVTFADGLHLVLSCRVAESARKIQCVEYYATNPAFDYFSQQGATSAAYFLGAVSQPAQQLTVPFWGGPGQSIHARLIFQNNETVDSAPVAVPAAAAAPERDELGLKLTALEHHLYPLNRLVTRDTVTLVGESTGLLTRPQQGDVTITAHLAGLTANDVLPDGTRLFNAGNWFSGLIIRNNLNARPGEPLGGAQIPYIAIMGSADGATRHCDSTMINGAGNQPSGDIGRDSKWFRLTRRGADLTALISKDGKTWKEVKQVSLPKLAQEVEVGFVHYSVPSATPCQHWAKFDHVEISK